MSKSNSGLFMGTKGDNAALVDELIANGIKCTPEDIIAILKNNDGKIRWLETGTKRSGFLHILQEHQQDFENQGISAEEIPNYIMEAIKQGNIVGMQGRKNPRAIYEFVYEGQIRRVAIQVSVNGYIVGANPRSI